MSIMLPRLVATPTMVPYQTTTPARNHFSYNQIKVEYNAHIEYNYSEVGGLMGVREIATPTMRGRTNGSL